TGAISQPLFGWLSDRGYGRLLGAGGLLWTVVGLVLSLLAAIAGERTLMIVLYAASAIGSGAFHPVGTASAAQNVDDAAGDTAWFFLFGQMGLALGPVISGILWGLTLGADGSGGSLFPFFLIAAVAVPSVLFMARMLPTLEQSKQKHAADDAATPAEGGLVQWRALGLLALLVLLRGLAYPGSVAFIPVLFRSKGWSPEAYGGITSAFWLASAAAGVLFGYLADRTDRRWVVTVTLLLAAPMYYLMPIVDGALAFLMVLAAGALVGGCHSIIVVLAQGMLPGRKGFASGVALGFIFGVGSLGTLALGYLSDGLGPFDGIGLVSSFQFIAIPVILAALMGFTLPATRPKAKRKPKGNPAAQGAD
ncbi:MAG: MFS transporter, partial [Chloroflexota bacterium]